MSNIRVSDLTAVVLAGGLGMRLANIVKDVPKPMAPVAGRPFLDYLVFQIKEAGCAEIIMCVGHRSDIIVDHFGNGSKFGIEIRYSYEEALLGTAGAIVGAKYQIQSDPFLIFNGDTFCVVDLSSLVDTHNANRAVATVAATHVRDASRYGSIQTDSDGVVQSFLEKDVNEQGNLVSCGIYIVNKEIFECVDPSRPYSIETELFPQLVGGGLYVFTGVDSFIDIGTEDSYQSAQIVLQGLIAEHYDWIGS